MLPRVKVRWHLAGAGAVLALLIGATPGPAADAAPDALQGRWEFASPAGAPLAFGPIYDFVPTGPGALANRVVRNWPIGCQDFDGQIKLTRISSPAAQPAYRGTFESTIPPTCRKGGPVYTLELTIRADGIAQLFFKETGVIQYFRRRSVQIGQLNLTFRDRIDKAVTELRPRALELGRRWNAVQREITDRSAAAAKLLDVSVEKKGIAKAERDLAVYQVGLARLGRLEELSPRSPGLAAIRKEWEQKVQDFRVEIGQLRTQIGKKDAQRAVVEEALRAAAVERARLDAALTNIGRRLSAYDFEISEVTVTADGVVVFQAKANTAHAAALKRIDAKLERMEASLAKLDGERVRARADFLAAQREALLAGERIRTIIVQNFAAGAAAEIGFLALDLGVASLRGGFIGLAAEVGKKAAETVVFAIAPLPKPGDDLDDIRRLYGESVKDAFSEQALGRTALDRVLKETHFKILVKDPATKYLKERVFDPVKFVAEFNQAGRELARELTNANLLARERSAKALLTTRSRLNDFSARQATKPGKLRSLAEGVAKDAAKVWLKKALDNREREAFITYFEKDLYARAVTAHFMAVSTEYWNAKAGTFKKNFELDVPGYDQLLGEKQRLLASPKAERILVNEPFSHGATLRITLKGQGRPGQLNVVLGGEPASPLGQYVYQLRASADRADAQGRLLLEVR